MQAVRVVLCLGLLAAVGGSAVRAEDYAFLVGVSDYDARQLKPLAYSRNDILAFHETLLRTGFDEERLVLMHDNLQTLSDRRYLAEADKIRRELSLLTALLEEDDALIVAFAGHGVQFRGDDESYFCPVDAELDDVGRETLVSITQIYDLLEDCPARRKLLLVDACRNDPQSRLARSRSGVELESVTLPQLTDPPEGLVALFSCAPGQQAFEHPELEHGIFFYQVLQAWESDDPVLSLDELIALTKDGTTQFARRELAAAQTPRQRGFFEGEWILRELRSVGLVVPRRTAVEIYQLLPQLISRIRYDSGAQLSEDATAARDESINEAKCTIAELGSVAVPSLIAELGNEEFGHYYHPWLCLVFYGRLAVPELIRALDSGDTKIRATAALVLRDIGPEASAAIPALLRKLEDTNSITSWNAAQALAAIASPTDEIMQRIIATAQSDTDRKYAARALIRLDPVQGFQHMGDTLVSLLDPNSPDSIVLDALSESGPSATAALPKLRTIFENPPDGYGKWVRNAAGEALALIDPQNEAERVVAYLIHEITRPDAEDTGYDFGSLHALGRLAEPAVPTLRGVYETRGHPSRRLALYALAEILEREEAVTLLREALEDRSPDVQRTAAHTICDDEFMPTFLREVIELTRNDSATVRWWALNSLRRQAPQVLIDMGYPLQNE